MMKTRLLAIAMVLVVALGMIACGNKNPKNDHLAKDSIVETELPYHLDYEVILPNNYSEDQAVHERNVLSVYVNTHNQFAISRGHSFSQCDINSLKDVIVDFMTPRPADESAPETEYITVNSIGEVLTTKGLILFRFHPSATTEDGYYAVINEMAKAYAALREEMAMKAFHKHLNQLNNEEHEAIREAVPVRVVGIGEYLWVPQISVVENDVEVDEGVDVNNAFVETCIKKVDDLDGIKTIVEDFNKNKVEVEVEDEIDVDQEIFTIVEEMPEFPGGMAKLGEYLSQNIKYPQMAREAGVQGKVFIYFVVETDGSISNVQVLRSLGGGCDEEAVRVVKSMPKWKPGKQRGQAVRVSYNLPVIFKL